MAEDVVEVKLDGLRDAQARLDALRIDFRKSVVYSALRDGGKPMVQAARASALTLTKAPPKPNRARGTISRNVKVFRSKKYRGTDDTIGVYITVKASKADLKRSPVTGDPYYWRWVEGGHRIVPRSPRIGTRYGKAMYAKTVRARRAAATGMVRPYKFLEPAFVNNAERSLRIIEQRLVERIAKAEAAQAAA